MDYSKPSAEEALASGATLHIKPEGNSMLPLIKAGRDSVYIQKVSFEDIKKGDVVLYRNEHHLLVLHRVCKKTPTVFYTVGDHQLLSAGPYDRNRLLGKMVAMERKGKYKDCARTSMRMYSRLWLLRRVFLLAVRALQKTLKP